MQHPYSSRGSVARPFRSLPSRPLPKRQSVLPLFDETNPKPQTFVIHLDCDGLKQTRPLSTRVPSWREQEEDSSESDDSVSDSSSFWSPDETQSMTSASPTPSFSRARHSVTSYSSTSTFNSGLDFACAGSPEESDGESDRGCTLESDGDAQYILIPPGNPLYKPPSSPSPFYQSREEYTPTGDVVFDLFAEDLQRTAKPSPPPSYHLHLDPSFDLEQEKAFGFDQACFQGLEAKLLLSPMDVFEDVCWGEFELDCPSSWRGFDDDESTPSDVDEDFDEEGNSWMDFNQDEGVTRDKPLPDVPSDEDEEELVDLYEYWGRNEPTLIARFSLAKPPQGSLRRGFTV